MAGGFKLFLTASLVGLAAAGCWRSAGLGAGAPDGGDTETDTLGGLTDPDTDGPWFYEWASSDVPTGDDLSGVYGFSSSDVFAVGENGTILHFDGAEWSGMAYPADAPGSDLGGVWGSSPSDVFAVGSDGAIIRYDGALWSAMDSGTSAHLHDVCGRAPDDVYAVGDDGTLLAYDGATWSPIATGPDRNLFAAWCAPGTAVYAAGHANDAFASSVLLGYDGAIAEISHPIADFLYALGGVAPDTVFIGGTYQTASEDLHFEISKSEGGADFENSIDHYALLIDLFAVGPTELFAVGRWMPGGSDPGAVYILTYKQGTMYDNLMIAVDIYLRGVWCDPDDAMGIAFAVGDDGTIFHGVPTQAY